MSYLINNGTTTQTPYSFGQGIVGSNVSLSVQGNMEFTKGDSYLQVDNNSVAVKDIIIMTKLFKRIIIDIANDPELSQRLPYVAEAAQEWLLEELKK